MLGFNSARDSLDLAQLMLDATIARSRHELAQSAYLLSKAVRKEDLLNYDEPPDWYLPPRESLGAVLLEDRRFSEAEVVFRAELKMHAKNPRALFGLAESLRRQGKTTEAAQVRKEFDEAWKYADLRLRIEDL